MSYYFQAEQMTKWDEAKHPRDEKGRFTDAGGGEISDRRDSRMGGGPDPVGYIAPSANDIRRGTGGPSGLHRADVEGSYQALQDSLRQVKELFARMSNGNPGVQGSKNNAAADKDLPDNPSPQTPMSDLREATTSLAEVLRRSSNLMAS